MDLSFKIPAQELVTAAIDPTPVLDKISTPLWNRLEARPRGEDMTRALKAEVRDAAWMLCRQWQMGEFAADDAGTPAFTNLQYTCAVMYSYLVYWPFIHSLLSYLTHFFHSHALVGFKL